jgi:hypothetical protein
MTRWRVPLAAPLRQRSGLCSCETCATTARIPSRTRERVARKQRHRLTGMLSARLYGGAQVSRVAFVIVQAHWERCDWRRGRCVDKMGSGDLPASPAVEIEPMVVGLNVIEDCQRERKSGSIEVGPVSACILLEHRQRQHFFVLVVINMHSDQEPTAKARSRHLLAPSARTP